MGGEGVYNHTEKHGNLAKAKAHKDKLQLHKLHPLSTERVRFPLTRWHSAFRASSISCPVSGVMGGFPPQGVGDILAQEGLGGNKGPFNGC